MTDPVKNRDAVKAFELIQEFAKYDWLPNEECFERGLSQDQCDILERKLRDGHGAFSEDDAKKFLDAGLSKEFVDMFMRNDGKYARREIVRWIGGHFDDRYDHNVCRIKEDYLDQAIVAKNGLFELLASLIDDEQYGSYQAVCALKIVATFAKEDAVAFLPSIVKIIDSAEFRSDKEPAFSALAATGVHDRTIAEKLLAQREEFVHSPNYYFALIATAGEDPTPQISDLIIDAISDGVICRSEHNQWSSDKNDTVCPMESLDVDFALKLISSALTLRNNSRYYESYDLVTATAKFGERILPKLESMLMSEDFSEYALALDVIKKMGPMALPLTGKLLDLLAVGRDSSQVVKALELIGEGALPLLIERFHSTSDRRYLCNILSAIEEIDRSKKGVPALAAELYIEIIENKSGRYSDGYGDMYDVAFSQLSGAALSAERVLELAAPYLSSGDTYAFMHAADFVLDQCDGSATFFPVLRLISAEINGGRLEHKFYVDQFNTIQRRVARMAEKVD